MSRIKIDDGTIRGNEIQLERIEIVIDDSKPTKVEIYMLDHYGARIEGGTFDRAAFMKLLMQFYNENF